MSQETRNALLHGQLQDELRYEIMKAPAVSGALSYPELCLASQNEEKRLLELKRRLQYHQPSAPTFRPARATNASNGTSGRRIRDAQPPPDPQKGNDSEGRKCYLCGKSGHLQQNCKLKNRRPESNPLPRQPADQGTKANMVCLDRGQAEIPQQEDPHTFLLSDSEEEDKTVSLVRVHDGGSKSQTALVEIAGVPAYGIVDTGADITIMGPELFKKVAMVAKLKKRQFKEADKVPHTYDRRQFKLDGRLDLDVNFDDKTINTPIYVKMDAYDDLLLSEGVCRHLGIVNYHPSIKSKATKQTEKVHSSARSVRVSLVDSIRLTPHKETLVSVKVDTQELRGPLLLESAHHIVGLYDSRLKVCESLVQVDNDSITKVLITNTSGSTCKLDKGEWLGLAFEVELVKDDTSTDTIANLQEQEALEEEAPPGDGHQKQTAVQVVTTTDGEGNRKRKLMDSVAEMGTKLPWQDKSKLQDLLCKHHCVFALEDGERGETGMVEMKIDTGDSEPKRQPARRTPFAARQEIARQLHSMEDHGVIRPSSSPCGTSPQERRILKVLRRLS